HCQLASRSGLPTCWQTSARPRTGPACGEAPRAPASRRERPRGRARSPADDEARDRLARVGAGRYSGVLLAAYARQGSGARPVEAMRAAVAAAEAAPETRLPGAPEGAA